MVLPGPTARPGCSRFISSPTRTPGPRSSARSRPGCPAGIRVGMGMPTYGIGGIVVGSNPLRPRVCGRNLRFWAPVSAKGCRPTALGGTGKEPPNGRDVAKARGPRYSLSRKWARLNCEPRKWPNLRRKSARHQAPCCLHVPRDARAVLS